ncbi:MAG: ATP-binding protein [Gemmobacter sp.]|jgi:serine/threonine-protein kinase RsbW
MPKPPEPRGATRHRIEACPEGVRAALGAIMAELGAGGLAEGARRDAEIVLAEVLTNIARHAYGGAGGPVRLALGFGRDGVAVCSVIDWGRPMPGGALPSALMPDPHHRPEGGFGWPLIRLLSAGVGYDRLGRRNRLRLRLRTA